MVARLLPLLLLAACAHRLDDLGPFPCPSADDYCPDGLACVSGKCVVPTVDGPCNDYTSCTLAGGDAICMGGACDASGCEVGACEQPCGVGGLCPAGRVCTQGAHVLGVCLDDCSLDGICPHGLACRDLGPRYVCVPPEWTTPMCASVQVTAACTTCGLASSFDGSCADPDLLCARFSTCTPGTERCVCGEGLAAFDCNEQLCAGGDTCPFPNWYCRPPEARLGPGCGDTLFRVEAICNCIDGRSLTVGCGQRLSCEQLCNNL
jgi:hypothetical protein